MTRHEFMEELQRLLQALPMTEQQDAMRYYEEYFDDAGPENEETVLSELGTPETVAKNIIANSTFSLANSPYQNGGKSREESSSQPRWNTGSPPRGSGNFQQAGNASEPKKSPTWVWVTLICTCPIWIPLAIGLLAVIFALFITLFSLAVAFGAATIALVVMFFFLLIVGVPLIFMDPLNGMLLIGMALVAIGFALAVAPLVWLLFSRGIPGFARFCGRMFRAARSKGN